MGTDAESQSIVTQSSPEVDITEGGKNIIRPDVLDSIMLAKMTREMTQIRRYFEDITAKGFISPMTLNITQVRQEIVLPYVAQAMTIINNTALAGGSIVYVWINTLMKPPHTMNPGEVFNINFINHVLAKVYFQCDPGNTSIVRAVPQE